MTPQTVEEQNDAENPFVVSTRDDFAAAVAAINAADSGEFTIKLANDISLSGDTEFTKNTTTILGEGHSLSGGNNRLLTVKGSAVLNLGSVGYTQTLEFDGTKWNLVIPVVVNDTATLNMYDGVTIHDFAPLGAEGGVQLNGESVFNMYGGTIRDCKDALAVTAGAVGVGNGDANKAADSCTFNMYGGTISNCSGGYGGGVRVRGGSFTMSGGTITGCTAAYWGGGVYATTCSVTISGGEISENSANIGGGLAATYVKTGWFPRNLIITGGTIRDNKAEGTNGYGGGIMLYNSSTAQTMSGCTITGNSAVYGGGVILMSNSSMDASGAGNIICNNTASGAGADVFLNKAEDNITLPDAAGMGQTFGTSGKKINGWYKDDPRYTPSEDAEAVDVSSQLKGGISLIASYKVLPEAEITVEPPANAGFDVPTDVASANTASKGERVQLHFDTSTIPADSNKMFGSWKVTDENGNDVPVDYPESPDASFEMPDCKVTVTYTLKNINGSSDDDSPADGTAGSEAGMIVAGAAIGTAGYLLGTRVWLESTIGFVPANREKLALALWNKAGCPQPQSTVRYTDIAEDDTDGQQAARWCAEQQLIKDYGESFKPGRYVFRPQSIWAWNQLSKSLKAQQ